MQGEYNEAVQAFDKTNEINPNIAPAWYNRGVALAKLGRTEEAEASIDKAKELGLTG